MSALSFFKNNVLRLSIRGMFSKNQKLEKNDSRKAVVRGPLCLHFSTALRNDLIFQGKPDVHNALVIESLANNCRNMNEFKLILDNSLKEWHGEKLKAVWFKIAVPQVEWIPHLREKGFKIHRSSGDYIFLYLWLPKNEVCKIPHYAHNMVGAGAAVLNDKNQILVVKEYFRSQSIWKLPGGYSNLGEDFKHTAIREVLEETGIKTEFKSLLAVRYVPDRVFGCSDMYFIVRLNPLSNEIILQQDEIVDCQWMDLQDFMSHKEVYQVLRNCVKEALQNEINGIEMKYTNAIHPITKSPQLIFSITRTVPNR